MAEHRISPPKIPSVYTQGKAPPFGLFPARCYQSSSTWKLVVTGYVAISRYTNSYANTCVTLILFGMYYVLFLHAYANLPIGPSSNAERDNILVNQLYTHSRPQNKENLISHYSQLIYLKYFQKYCQHDGRIVGGKHYSNPRYNTLIVA